MKFSWWTRVFSNYLPSDHTLIVKGRKVPLLWRNLVASLLSKWSKISKRANRCHVSPNEMHWEGHITCVVFSLFCPQSITESNYQGIIGQTQTKGLSTKKLACTFQKRQCQESKERLRNGYKLMKTKETWQLSAMHDPGLDPELEQGCHEGQCWENGQLEYILYI